MKELALFAGAGLGVWATHHLLGWECLGYVEWNNYCQRVLRARIDDGLFCNAPIFGDIRHFIQSGAAEQYRGFIDVVTGGFPCQPFSAAGPMLRADDPRNMWPATAECLRIIRPQYALLENVPALINSGYFERILGDLAEMGMDAIWGVFSACALGAPHTRERLFILAYPNGGRLQNGIQQSHRGEKSNKQGAQSIGLYHATTHTIRLSSEVWRAGYDDLLRMADGDTDRGYRIKAAGNGQVPVVVATAWHTLSRELMR